MLPPSRQPGFKRLEKWRDWPTDEAEWNRQVARYEAKYRPLVQALISPTELVALSNVALDELNRLSEEFKAASTETMRERGPRLASRGLGNR